MTRNISVEGLDQIPIEKQRIELVERKCLGHPDSLADGIAESISRALSRSYLEECGSVLHHNTDQGEVVAGESIPKFGGGRITKPIYFLISGRATKTFNGVNIPADAIAVEAARDYIRSILPTIDMNRDLIVDCRMGNGSTDLRDVFRSCEGKVPRANDTSFGVGHAPFSEAESVVRGVAAFLDNELRLRYPVIGQDCKIMCLRDGDAVTLTIAMAFVDRYCSSIAEYIELKNILTEQITLVAKQFTSRKINVAINTADDLEGGSVFLTVSGTSAEMGDDGSVGRGNRANGLITPNRPMSMEATSGKNPINHIGKIYNLLATQIAQDCVTEVDGIEEMYVRILSQIGYPIDQPHVASAQVLTKPGVDIRSIKPDIEGIIDGWLGKITTVTEKVIRGELSTF
ncbi:MULTISPECIES: methionine adenosyltransferase [unclassified Methanoculleus]|uniref:methionine adenosyltransferase n=1 Tax=unclassified Methanoculleus TaxID=2619537 RepID=UPI0025FBE984|nr:MULTISPECIES: methionine adenosyltransferase [unclassified Methanoculleus]MCK9316995.1 methionine adenosyltransferase [Methanoculleus sp.]MDD2252869.1 methionine adenosyltransferase [Methanoculleus sp.]MDD2787241.1 methionine adenosyltransferase [Methanoculleus sp.]MDD3215714.1 methionine adenosyltransferase [Methanoculleus sp.]MDD4313527.1 methionine adenosyltransferase [Methanoculleus sp.]